MVTTNLLAAAAGLAALAGATPLARRADANTTASAVPPVVSLANGMRIHGKINTTASPSVAQYLGIPYAAPPVGQRRWAAPEPFASLYDETAVNATALPKSCWQYVSVQPGILRTDAPEFMIGAAGMSEDCLTASVWAPAAAVANASAEPLPVLIWFYGGGFATGGEDVPYQIPDKWVERSGEHIVVSFNYRINIFGFPNAAALGDDEQNLGLMDQRFAVEWIRDNIAAFGGDPEKMVIWGQSAGAVAVDYYNFAQIEDPIVKGLIMDSGTAHLDQLTSWDLPHSNFSFVASGLGCGNQTSAAAELACMRDVPGWKIEKFVAEYEDSGESPSITFSPRVDNKWVFGNYTERARNGDVSDLVSGDICPIILVVDKKTKRTFADACLPPFQPAIIGFNKAEGLFLAPYSVDGPDPATAATLGYEYFWCPATKTTYERLDAGLTTHRYFYAGNFSNVSPRPWNGAYHSSELPLLFGTHGDFRGASTAFEVEVSHALQDAWVAFARDPKKGLDGVEWPKYKGKNGGGEVRQFAVGEVVVQTGDVVAIEEECVRRGLV
ncbi:putative chlorogenic acid esterase precursor protein [Neofusicoccum parvum UCRNP2]|uniref:Carboxylic ester hydrolase n=1 Tax=Botryosphaeria parva (strain UCR-NP2) TaxID=1287680 RepID=R1ENX6_BOTPV|nr:putative chlorogenic acid esterase precursor protein [Neofusicoccum parvum UCRNP2]